MYASYIVSTGTSIVTNIVKNYKDETEKNLQLMNQHTKKEAEEHIDAIVDDFMKIIKQHYNDSIDSLKRISAEINAIVSISPGVDPDNDKIYLIATDTVMGYISALLNKVTLVHFMDFESENISIEIVGDTDVRSGHRSFQKYGVPNLFNTVANIKSSAEKEKRNLFINISGGFKPISTTMAIAGILLNIETHYSYQDGELIRMPLFPIGINIGDMKKGDTILLKELYSEEKIDKSDVKRFKRGFDISKFMISDDGEITEIGRILLAAYIGTISDTLCKSVLNRESFEEYMQRIFVKHSRRRLKREGNSYMVAFFDLDKFKQINDTHGHIVGDTALKSFADTLHTFERKYKGTIFGRYGGDEFIGLFSCKTYEESKNILQEIVDRVKEVSISKDLNDKLSTTIGAIFIENNNGGISWEEYKDKADQQLIKLKKENMRGQYLLVKTG